MTNVDAPLLSADGSVSLPKTEEIHSLTGLRGLAAFDVALIHLCGAGALKLVAFHSQAVDIFFCLSGFTLSLAYGVGSNGRLNFRAFIAARFARVYPLYFFALVLSAIYSPLFGVNAFSAYAEGELLADGLRQVLMINALPIVGTGVHWIDPMWSLSIEAFCYVALFPILFKVTTSINNISGQKRVASILMLSGFTFGFYVLYINPGVNSHQVPPATGPFIHWVGVVRGTLMFTCGWLAYTIYANVPEMRRAAAEMVDLVVLAIALILIGNLFGVVDIALIVVLAPFLILGISSGNSFTVTVLRTSVLQFLGRISYSLYILHWPVMVFFWEFGGALHPKGVRVAAALVFSIALAHLSYTYVEAPLRRILRNFLMAKATRKLAQ